MPYRRGEKWIGCIQRNNRQKEKICLTKKEALDWESRMRKLSEEEWAKTLITYSIHDRANEYLDFCLIKFSDSVYKEKKFLFKRFFKIIDPQTDPEAVTPKMALDYLSEQAKSRSGYAANKDRKNLKAFWNWGIRYHDFSLRNPFNVDRFPEKRKTIYIPPEEDFWKILDKAEGQDKTMLLCYLHTAARRSELFRLRWDDVDFFGRRIRLLTRKRKDGSWEADWIPMTDDLFKGLTAQRTFVAGELVFPRKTGYRNQKERAFTRRNHIMKFLCKEAEVRNFGFLAIRHLTASILDNQGVPLKVIQEIMRHRNIHVTSRYIHSLRGMREALTLLQRT
jgi:integrase